jgi:hypothetical protein
MPFRLAALVTLLAADPVAATCPVSRADAEAGVLVTMDDGSTIVITRGAANTVSEDWTYPDGFRLRLRAVHGVHAIEFGEIDAEGAIVPGTEETTEFAGAMPPEPVPGQVWSTTGRVFYGPKDSREDGGEITYNSVVRAEGTLQIGACTYAALTVTNRIGDASGARLEEVDFLPDLGVAILRVTAGGLGQDRTTMTPVSIAPGPP